MQFVIYADGGARGNPGPAGSGAVVLDDKGHLIAEVSEFLGHTTNNVAEYTGIIRALEKLLDYSGQAAVDTDVLVRMDSLLVVKQMNGEYKIKHPNLVPLAARVKELTRQFRFVSFEHIYRVHNKEADKRANEAMDRGR
ncbi:MAG: reverse transcriptase-like protein [Candidatus Pacebacteria bacterium]|nr:reverse transcriptase-like protein [Candidatus Paceibacterota bacterium]